MPKFIRIRQVSTIPSHQKVTFMIGRQSQMQGITTGIGGHYLVPDVRLHDLNNGRLNGQKWKVADKGQPLCTALWHVTA